MPRVLIFEPDFRRVGSRLEQAAAGVEMLVMDADGATTLAGARVDLEATPPDAGWLSPDVFAGPAARAMSVALLKAPALRWVQSGAAGVDHPLFGRLAAKGAVLTTSTAQSDAIAEFVLAAALDHFQRGPERRAAQAANRWSPLPFREVAGTHWLVFGFGGIGEAIGARARALGAEVTGVRRRPGPHPAADRLITPDGITGALRDADVVVLSAPLTAATANVADARFFAAMKTGALFVNVGRGGLVDEEALLAALDRGVPACAVLDVFRQEPLPSDSPFWTHPRVRVTPHAAAIGDGRTARGDALFLDNLARFVRGEPLRHVAPPEQLAATPVNEA